VKVSVGGPFFNRMTVPMIVALLFLMGVGPALPWKSASRAELRAKLLPPVGGAVVLAVIAVVMGIRDFYGILAFAFVGYSATANLREFWLGTRARHTAHGESWPTALVRLVAANRRRHGGYIAHLGVFLIALGVTASSSLRTENEATLKPGETLSVKGRTVRLRQVWGREERQRSVVGATLEVLDRGRVVGVMEPRMNFYPMSQQPVPTPDVRSGPGGDLYLNLMAVRPDGSTATVKAIYEPLVPWIWFGGGVIVFGAILCAWPTRRQRAAATPVVSVQKPFQDNAA
jgi:cytochrome c-type biogenesis protein CcmF